MVKSIPKERVFKAKSKISKNAPLAKCLRISCANDSELLGLLGIDSSTFIVQSDWWTGNMLNFSLVLGINRVQGDFGDMVVAEPEKRAVILSPEDFVKNYHIVDDRITGESDAVE